MILISLSIVVLSNHSYGYASQKRLALQNNNSFSWLYFNFIPLQYEIRLKWLEKQVFVEGFFRMNREICGMRVGKMGMRIGLRVASCEFDFVHG